jgi:hypothetical protein
MAAILSILLQKLSLRQNFPVAGGWRMDEREGEVKGEGTAMTIPFSLPGKQAGAAGRLGQFLVNGNSA